ncbi:MAG: hypothetical protein WBF17_21705 [Phycisphaerae bacterium]
MPGIVSHVKVLSDNVPDVSSLAAWKKSFIRDGVSDRDKALAVWKSNVMFVYQDPPPIEFLHEGCVHDAIKSFNVYGYGMCCCASSRVESLGRYLGLPARGWGIMGHSVPELSWAGQWHMLDASLVNYFPQPDGKIASVADICKAVQDWLKEHPEYKGDHKKLVEFHRAGGWSGWRAGPKLLAGCPSYGNDGWFPAKTHGWYSTMQEYDGGKNTPFPYEYGYSQGYQVNIQLRPGERLTRNWFHKGLHVNGVGSGRREYDVPLAGGGFRGGALQAVNLADNARDVHVKDPARQAVLDLAMPTSYVYLTGTKRARVRWVGRQRNTTCIFLVRIDADYRQPHGGFRPVQVTCVWEEGGLEKRNVHIARRPRETWKIRCDSKPAMKSIILELPK